MTVGTMIRAIAIAGLTVIGAFLAMFHVFTFIFFAAYMAVGAILAMLRPRNVVGWLLIIIAFGFIATTTPPSAAVSTLVVFALFQPVCRGVPRDDVTRTADAAMHPSSAAVWLRARPEARR